MGTTPTLQDRLDSDSCPEQSSNCDLHPPPPLVPVSAFSRQRAALLYSRVHLPGVFTASVLDTIEWPDRLNWLPMWPLSHQTNVVALRHHHDQPARRTARMGGWPSGMGQVSV